MKFHKCESCRMGDGCVCEETCSLDERCNCEIFGNLPKQEDGEVAKVTDKVRVKRRELVIHLPWYKTQWGAGLILGLELGLIAGIPIAFIVYQLAVVVVRFISAS